MGLVKGIAFDSWRRVGSAMQAVKVYNMREVDELVFLDISATLAGRSPDFDSVDDLADECFMPLTVGGGVRSVDDVRRLLSVGADKIAVNTGAVECPGLIRQIAGRFGSQCVVVSIDYRRSEAGCEVFTRAGTQGVAMDPVTLAKRVEEEGAGEILLTSIDRDGTMAGYDLETLRRVADAVAIPVIASGGAGSYEHMAEALQEGRASAVAAASMFHFTEGTPLAAKHFLAAEGFNMRL
ncbi:MAG: imidazole glycerol phosphate synthase subunit HisF [Chloroflexota bacterium]